jgi:hypothetical protein
MIPPIHLTVREVYLSYHRSNSISTIHRNIFRKDRNISYFQMATPVFFTKITDAKVLAAQISSSLQPDGIVWFLLEHFHELTEQQLCAIVEITDPYWILVFLKRYHHDDDPEVQSQMDMMRLGVMMARMNPYEIISFLINQELFQMALDRIDPYWSVLLLKRFFSSQVIIQEDMELYRRAVAQSDSFTIVELLGYLLYERSKSDNPAPESQQYYTELFCIIVERADSKGLLRFLKTHGSELTDDEFRRVIQKANLNQLTLFLKSDPSTLTEERKWMITERINLQGEDTYPLVTSHPSESPSIEEAGPSTLHRADPYKRVFDKNVIATSSPAQLRISINHFDPETVVAYFESHFLELSEVQFEIFVANIDPKSRVLFLKNNHFNLPEQRFRTVIEELDNEDIVSFLETDLLKLTDEERRMAFCMAVGWVDFEKLMQVLENYFPRMTVEEFCLITERAIFLMEKNDNLWERFEQFFRSHLFQLTDEQLCIMIGNLDGRAFQMLEEDKEFQKEHFLQLSDKRFAIIRWGIHLENNTNVMSYELPGLTGSKRDIQFRLDIDRKGEYAIYSFGLLPCPCNSHHNLKHLSDLTDDQFRMIVEKSHLDDVVSFYNMRLAELTDKQHRIVAERLSKP